MGFGLASLVDRGIGFDMEAIGLFLGCMLGVFNDTGFESMSVWEM